MGKAQDKISEKKLQLESNLARIQEGLDNSIDGVKGDVVESISPKEVVKKYPIPIVGASILLGFIIGSKGGTSKHKSPSKNNTIANLIGNSLKKRLTQKAVDIALDFIDGKLKEQKRD